MMTKFWQHFRTEQQISGHYDLMKNKLEVFNQNSDQLSMYYREYRFFLPINNKGKVDKM